LIGIVGLNKESSDLAVLTDQNRRYQNLLEPDLRYNFIQATKFRRCKTLMITSSVSGGGNICAINIATVFALSEKKDGCIRIGSKKTKVVLPNLICLMKWG
jgi:hypothetical protein